MNIALVVPDTSTGGVETVTANLATALTDLGETVTLLALRRATNRASGGYDPLGGPATPWLESARRLTSRLRIDRVDVVVAAKERANAAALIAARRTGARVVVTRHVPLDRATVGADAKPGLERFYRHVVARADAVVGVSNALADQLKVAVGTRQAHKVHALNNAVLGPGWASAAGPPPPDLPGRPLLVASGRLCAQKGFADLIDAVAQMTITAHLLVLGDGPLRHELTERAAQRGVADRVTFAGHVAHPLPFVAQADVFVLSSHYEGLPTALIEACAVAPRVVATDCPTGPSQILGGGEHGELVPVGDSTALARALDNALAGETATTERFDTTPYTFAVAGQAWLDLLRGLRPTGPRDD